MPVGEIASGLIAKFIGAFWGAIIALLRFPPKDKAEAARRFITSLVSGVISASVVVYKLGLEDKWESALFAGMLTAFLSWPILGILDTLVEKWVNKKTG